MLTKCYAVYSQFPLVLPSYEIKGVYRFTSDKKTAKRAVKHLKKQGMRKADFIEINPTDWAIVIYSRAVGDLPIVIAQGMRYRHEAERAAELFRQAMPLNVTIQKFDETQIFEMSKQEDLLTSSVKGFSTANNGGFYA